MRVYVPLLKVEDDGLLLALKEKEPGRFGDDTAAECKFVWLADVPILPLAFRE